MTKTYNKNGWKDERNKDRDEMGLKEWHKQQGIKDRHKKMDMRTKTRRSAGGSSGKKITWIGTMA